jgi:selT/selW/selH-like putative selenoprotein
LAAEIESQFGTKPELIKSAGGKFEIVADGELVFSKLQADRFPEPTEVLAELAKLGVDR